MDEHCTWPKCRQPVACFFQLGTKSWRLCEYHGDLVQDEDLGVLKRARKKIGMPMPVVEIRPELPAELPTEPEPSIDFSDIETQLVSGDYDWDAG